MKKKLTSLFITSCLCITTALSPVPDILHTSACAEAKTYVYYSPAGSEKYHPNRYCRTLARSKKIKKIALKKAKSKGLTKCKVCG